MSPKTISTKPTPTTIILTILIVAVLAFIWSNSLENRPESQEKSLNIVELVKPFLEPVVGIGNVTDHLVRKLAHFMEFGVLGILLALYVAVRGRIKLQSVVNCLSFGLVTAVIDEALQLISARGSQVQDVLLDFSGIVTGVFFTFLICVAIMKSRQKRVKQ